jgi:hypothetical protein
LSEQNPYRYAAMVAIPTRTLLGEQLTKVLSELRDKLSQEFPMSGFRIGIDRTALWLNVEMTGKADDDAVRFKCWEFSQQWAGKD